MCGCSAQFRQTIVRDYNHYRMPYLAVNAELLWRGLYPSHEKQARNPAETTGNRYKIEILMSRNILELKSIKIAPEKVQTLSVARRLVKLKGIDLKEEYFELVYHPADLVKNIASYVEGKTYRDSVSVADIKGTLHASYYDNNWLVMMMSLDRHKNDFDVEKVKEAIINTQCFEPIHLSKYGDIYFINGGGNHRVCQAKFLGIETVQCEVTEFVIEKTVLPG